MKSWPADQWFMPNPSLVDKIRKLRILVLDVDGVLTDGTILRLADGTEARKFSVYDGHGLGLLKSEGWVLAAVSREPSMITKSRLEKLNFDEIHIGIEDKGSTIVEMLNRLGIKREHAAFFGDDLPDISAFENVGIRVAPNGAHPVVEDAADIVTISRGGYGAVREICEIFRACHGKGPYVGAHTQQ